ncbi:MAG: hypothetical protein KIT83_02785 [Bryobacterales bacterium]|nr:hypothetical protein [Bryobacterales bacterium]
MQLHAIFQGLGDARFRELLAQISMGRLKTYQLYEPLKVRTHLHKLNADSLKKAAPRLWDRVVAGDEALASEVAQSVLVSKMEVVIEVLDFLGIPHRDGFFEKETPLAEHLTEGWQRRVYEAFHTKHSPAFVVFYVNHLAKEAHEDEVTLFSADPA